MQVNDSVTLPALPMQLRWLTEPASWNVSADGLRIEAGPRTDRFVDPHGGAPILNAPALVGPAEAAFQLGARVAVELAEAFDGGALLVSFDEGTWAKLCLEYSPDREPMVVSVVTRAVSDDCNSFVVAGNEVWLRVSRVTSTAFAFHASTDGARWKLIRHFALGDGSDPEIGFTAQSPLGGGCTAAFSEVGYVPEALDDIRSGQ